MEEVTGFIGRECEIEQAAAALEAGNSVVVKGRAGIGKRAMLRQVHAQFEHVGRVCLWPEMSTMSAMVQSLAHQVHERLGLEIPERLIPPRWRAQAHREGRVPWKRIQRSVLREPAREVLALVVDSIRGRGAILFTESLEVPPTLAVALHELAEVCQLAACMDKENRRVRIQRLLWRFQKEIELKPLTKGQVAQLVERWLKVQPIEFDGPKVRAGFIRAVQLDSGGVPAAVEGMLVAATNDREVSRSCIRKYRHEAAAVYWDMTPLVMVLVIGFMALRYISRGIGETELLVLAGVGSSLFWGMMFVMRKLSR